VGTTRPGEGTLIDQGTSLFGADAREVRSAEPPVFDFRRPSKFSREHVRTLENLHESFARRFATSLSHALRGVVQLRPIAVEELTYENYVRSLPNPSALTLVSLRPLPGEVIVETGVSLALTLIDRALGGLGSPAPLRRLTDLEKVLLADVMRYGVGAFAETFAPVLSVEPEVLGVETNPSFLQVVPPSETTLLLSYAFSIAGSSAVEGLLTVCYPHPTLQPVMDRLQRHGTADPGVEQEPEEVREPWISEHLAEATVVVSACLNTTAVPARDIAGLAPGDVLSLDHRVDEPVRVRVQGIDLMAGFLGRRGRRLGVRFTGWRTEGS
jgi:flagellar motor switch protein FliM